MKESGLVIKRMGKALILTLTELTTMGTGLKINNMDLEWNPGQMVRSTKVTTSEARKKAKVSSLLLMEAITRGSSGKMKYAGMESTIGLMESTMTGNGAKTKCTDKEP